MKAAIVAAIQAEHIPIVDTHVRQPEQRHRSSISLFGKMIRIGTKSVRITSGIRLLNLDTDDKVASATVIPPEDPKVNGPDRTLLQ
jgi:hypothetical protein